MGEPHKTQGIVLRRVDYGENDRILTLFSPADGLLTVTAKGVKKPTAKLRAAAELFTYGEYILAESKGRYVLTAFDCLDSFPELREDFDRLTGGALLLHICEKTVNQGEPELFTLLLRCLDKLRDIHQPVGFVLAVFFLKFCTLEGYAPQTEACIHCGITENLCYLDIPAGGLCCGTCREENGCRTLSPACLFFFRKILASSMDLVFRLKPTREQTAELYHLTCAYTAFYLDRRLKLLEYIEKYKLV